MAEDELTVWDVFNEYADIRDELEDSIGSFNSVIEDIQAALVDLDDELSENISTNVIRCSVVLKNGTQDTLTNKTHR